MTLLIIIFGTLTCLAGLTILFNPEIFFSLIRNHSSKVELHILAVAVRLLLGILLLIQSDVSRYPLVIEVIGWLSITAALVLALIGRGNFIKLMQWALSMAIKTGRISGVFAAAFGAFLVYAFS